VRDILQNEGSRFLKFFLGISINILLIRRELPGRITGGREKKQENAKDTG
jgi:hypothetical protein